MVEHQFLDDDDSSRCRPPTLQWINVRQVIDSVCHALRRRMVNQRIETVADVPRFLAIRADGELLRAAVLNLTINALDAMSEGGRLVITACMGARGFELEVADSGPGLSEEVRRRAFEPCFTTKSGGAGMGLAVVRRIAIAHGGDIVATNCPEGGAAFTLRIPSHLTAAAA
jgi:signal transduction histidine kinase